jgi:hypothetical protein
MTRNSKLLYASVTALLLSGVFPGAAQAAGLVCQCKDLDKCVLQKGREAVPFAANNPATYDADEKSAMQQADAAADQKGQAAQQMWESKGLTCPQPCDPEPQIWMKHGKPFAAATNGQGEARSVWKVSYICEKTPQKDQDSDTNGPVFNLGIGIGIGGHHGDNHRDSKHDDRKHDDKTDRDQPKSKDHGDDKSQQY